MSNSTSGAKATPEALISKFELTKLLKQGASPNNRNPATNQLTTRYRSKWPTNCSSRHHRWRTGHPHSRASSLRDRIPRSPESIPRRHRPGQEPRRQRHLPLVPRLIGPTRRSSRIFPAAARSEAESHLAVHGIPHQEILRPAAAHGNRDAGDLPAAGAAVHAGEARRRAPELGL